MIPHPFKPIDIAGCRLWVRPGIGVWTDTAATTPARTTGDSIARWDDQSGRGNNPIQASVGNVPKLATSVAAGRTALANDGVSGQSLAVTSGGPTGAHTIIVAARLNSSPAGFTGYACVSRTATSNRNSTLGVSSSGKFWCGGFGNTGLQGSTLTLGIPLVLTKKYDGTNVSGYINGSLNVGPTPTTLTSLAADMGISEQFGDGGFANSYLFEVVIYDTALTPQQQRLVEDYFMRQMGIGPKRALASSVIDLYSATLALTVQGSGTLTGAGSLTAAPVLLLNASGTLTGAGSLTAASRLVLVSGGTLTGAGSVTVAPSLRLVSGGSLTGTGSLAATSTLNLLSGGTLTGMGVLISRPPITTDLRPSVTGIPGMADASRGRVTVTGFPEAGRGRAKPL